MNDYSKKEFVVKATTRDGYVQYYFHPETRAKANKRAVNLNCIDATLNYMVAPMNEVIS